MYPLLWINDSLPTVGLLQVLLNRTLTDGKLAKDGYFGPKTKKAVEDFQRVRHLKVDGIVGEVTWPRLIAGTGFEIIDAVDITEADDAKVEPVDIRNVGGRPILTGAMSNGVVEVLRRVGERMSQASGRVVLIRFHGHGSPGEMGISSGKGDVCLKGKRVPIGSESRTYIERRFPIEMQRELLTVSAHRSLYGSVELHGCRVGAGADGHRLLEQLSRWLAMPVTAGIYTQLGGGESTFRFEGPTRTFVTRYGTSLKTWAAALPDMQAMSPA